MFDATDGSGNWSCGTNGIVKDRDTGKELQDYLLFMQQVRKEK